MRTTIGRPVIAYALAVRSTWHALAAGSLLSSIVLIAGGVGVGGCEPDGCVDADEDGLGLRCPAGPDCDDTNPERTTDCDVVPPPDCNVSPTSPGCPCLPDELDTCYRGPAGTRGVGACRVGRVRCTNGHFGLCLGEVLPQTLERCDGVDDDCDGRVDERVTSPCGACDASCVGGVWGNDDAPFTASPPLVLTEHRALTLEQRELAAATVWVTNTADGTVSRLDASRALELSRHLTAEPSGANAEPTRVAVDFAGDAWVLNRTFGGQGSATKIAGSPERCVDRDGDGVITTSSGPSPVPFARDECVLVHVPVGEPAHDGEDGAVPRAIAIDGDRGLDGASGGNPWIGLYGEHAVVQLDGVTGAALRRIALDDVAPYLAAIDSLGVVWIGSQRGVLVRIDPTTAPPTSTRIELRDDCFETYSLAIDTQDRLYLTGYSCDRVWRYEPWRGVFTPLTVPPSPRGAALVGDSLWLAHTGGLATEVALDTFTVRRTIDLGSTELGSELTPRQTIGSALDSVGHAWLVSETGGAHGGGLATRVSLASGAVDAQVEVGRAPHVQGDLSGWQRIGQRAPEGSARHVFTGCGEGDPTDWRAIHVHAQLGTGGELEVQARRASDEASLASVPLQTVGLLPRDAASIPLTLEPGGVVEVVVTLRTRSHRSAPLLELVGLEWACSGPS